MKIKKFDYRFILILFWSLFTVTLGCWWVIFNLRQIEKLQNLAFESASELVRHQRMLLFEGITLVILVLLGAVALLSFMERERKKNLQVKEFFATFTHELKTALASVRLQGESLEEDLRDSGHQTLVSRLVGDTVRLELQLENSLFLAHVEQDQLFFEDIGLKRLLSSISHQFPMAELQVSGEAQVHVDRRCFESVLKNTIQNAIHHGGAKQIHFAVSKKDSRNILISITNDGRGFKGNPDKLGELFVRHSTSSGSGVGLYLVKELMQKMHGLALFKAEAESFRVELQIEGQIEGLIV